MNKALILLVLNLLWATVQGQTLARNDALKFDADYYMMEKDFGKATSLYTNILKSEPENADIKYRLGICYLNSEGEKEKAIPYLEEAVQKISEKYNPGSFKETNAPVDAYFLLGSAYRVNNQIDKAIEAYNQYRTTLDPKDEYNQAVIEQYLRNCNQAKELLKKPLNITMVNLGTPVNTGAPNFNPVLSGDGKTVLYTSPGRQGYDIFTSALTDNIWSAPRNITTVLGTGKYMKTSDLSYDGLTLLLTLDDPMNADIYISHFSKGKWSKVEPLGKDINSKSNETHASLSADGKVLYFTSNRKGGQGDMDIYKSEQDAKGEWGKPVNLGTAVNTPFNEETPFITDDGQKLFFSSEGHDGMGGYDIFCYDFSNPGAGALNVGYPLNTTDNDLFFAPWGDGTMGYYSVMGSDSYGGRDIYQVMVPVVEPVAVVVEEPAVAVEEPVAAAEEPATAVAVAVEEPVAAAEEPAAAVAVAVEEPVAVVEEGVGEGEMERVGEEPVAAVAAAVEEPAALAAVVVEEPAPALAHTTATATATATANYYKVQIMALRKPVDPGHFAGLEGLTMAYGSDSWYRYTLGNTAERQEAERVLAEIIAKGYSDAFIRDCSIIPQFTIQVMAVPGPVVDLTRFSNLREISVSRGTDRFCRYTTGEYGTKEEALADLEKIKALGYREAFVTRVRIPQ